MWEMRTQFSKPNAELHSGELEWNSVAVPTFCNAVKWWGVRSQCVSSRRVSVMFDPAGAVVQVRFD